MLWVLIRRASNEYHNTFSWRNNKKKKINNFWLKKCALFGAMRFYFCKEISGPSCSKAKATHIFFSKNISIYTIFNDQSFDDMLTKDIVSFEQLGPGPGC